MNELKCDVRKSRRAAFAVGTNKNLKVQWRAYLMFCIYFQLDPVPATLDDICLFAQFLSRSFKTVAAIRNYLSGVKLLHLFLGKDYPDFSAFELKLALKGLQRLNPHCPKQAFPITPEILWEFFGFLDMDNPSHICFWCLFLFGFFLMLRKSNLVPDSMKSFDETKNLQRKDILMNKRMLIVLIKWSKTIQFGQRKLQIPLLSNPGSPLCPVWAFKRMIKYCPVSSSSPAFSYYEGHDIHVITYRELQVFLRKLISLSGRDANLYSSHSFRRGGASWAFRAKVPGELIQLHGDWASDAYKQYLHFPMESKMFVAARMRNLINRM